MPREVLGVGGDVVQWNAKPVQSVTSTLTGGQPCQNNNGAKLPHRINSGPTHVYQLWSGI